ncbi:hypothetical protein [Actinopolyspora mortivallis]|uniref:Uncharacterized protein n=1 Tax=Actinopolyspora mortivallis TaxID=33906 RepID=A0A2T0GWW7_ACTMO|nr:hypothetical protein [Actinopolyspora mortivallis]PRW63601.1 hypothetical protein CEP50_09795 [Actinopolyspora mortivallis]
MDQSPESENSGGAHPVLVPLLALLGVLAHGSWMLESFEGWKYGIGPLELLGGVSNLLVVAGLGVGTLGMLLRRRSGRWITAGAAVGAIVVITVVVVFLLVELTRTGDGSTAGFLEVVLSFLLVALLGPILTLVLTLTPP